MSEPVPEPTAVHHHHNHDHAHHHGQHQHGDNHQHSHGGDDFAVANAQHFNEHGAKGFEEHPFAKELTERQAAAYLAAYPFDEEKTALMDFACGPGLVSRELASHTKQIVGVDITQNFVDEFNKRVSDQGISPEEMKAVCVHLKGEDGELDNMKFDVIICGMAYHHISSIADTTKMLAFFLKPGGALLVIDMLKEEGGEDFHRDLGKPGWEKIVAHKGGFAEEDLRTVFEGADLAFELSVVAKAKHHGFPTKLVLAKGTKKDQ
ncbi:hypothetical protein ONZ45_g10554 [Pleurotus djamor]|nr:hypothetical protein ONZ45_g10554 [Pleurotus djamor]